MAPNKIIDHLTDPSPAFVGGFALIVVAIWLVALICLLGVVFGT